MSRSRQQSLRDLREAALASSRKGHYAAALERFRELERMEPTEPDWPRRAAECQRALGDVQQQLAALGRAAELYAQAGSMAKAIAMCRMILTLDPEHTQTQERLSALQQQGALAAPRFPPVVPPHSAEILVPPAPETPRPRPELGRLLRQKYIERHKQGPGSQRGRTLSGEMPAIDRGRTLSGEMPTIDLEPALPFLPQRSLKEAIPSSRPIRDPHGAPSGMHSIDMGELRQAERSLRTAQKALPAAPLFSELGPRSLQRLIERARLDHVERGDAVYRPGDAAVAIHVIVSGSIALLAEPGRVEVARLKESEFFGEAALMSHDPRNATARALEATDVLSIDCATIRDLIADEPQFLNTVLRFLRERLIESSLLTNPLFTILSDAERRRLATQFDFLEIDPGTLLIWQGVRSPGLFLLLSGTAEVVHDDSSAEYHLATLRPGAVFGEMSLLDDTAAMADVRCQARSYALLLPRAEFPRVAKEYPPVVEFIQLLCAARRRENQLLLGTSERADEGTEDR